jgi:glyoxylase-like metal-dependent hydrolase (beta-lactamase superfamily II)
LIKKAALLIESRSLWVAQTNTYVIAPESGGPGFIVDAPPDIDSIVELVSSLDVAPVALLITHGHVDHGGAAGQVSGRYGIRAYVHPDDDYLSLEPTRQIQALMGIQLAEPLPVPDFEPLIHGQVIRLAGIDIEVIHTPGHTPGHVCFRVPGEGVLLSGDQLFAGSIGRTDLPGGSFEQLLESMKQRVLTLDDDIIVFPGHGPATTVGRERRTNPFLQGLSP